MTQNSGKGRTIVDHLAHCSQGEVEDIQGDFLVEDNMRIEVESWKMYFNGTTIKTEVELEFS